MRDLRIGKPHALEQAKRVGIQLVQTHAAQVFLHHHDIAHAADEPRVDARGFVHRVDRPAAAQRLGHVEDAILRGTAYQVVEVVLVEDLLALAVGVQARAPVLKRTHGLAKRLFERAADGHDLAHGLHAGGKRIVGALELLEREARHLHHAVIDGRLEARRRCLRDVVDDLVERVADGQTRGGFRDGETGGFRRKRGRARHARVHLDDHHAAILRVHGELHVRAARLHTHLLQDGKAGGAHALVFHVGERLRRSHGDGVARVHAHGVEVLDGAYDDAVAGAVAHDLHLELFPAFDGFLHQHLARRRKLKALRHDQAQLVFGVRDAAAGAAHGEAGAQHHGVPKRLGDGQRVFNGVRVAAARRFDAQLGHAVVEQLAVFAALDGVKVAADHFHAVLVQHAGFGQLNGGVQTRLAAECGQQRVGLLFRDDLFHELGRDGLDVGAVGHGRVGHDGGGVRIHQHHAVTLFFEHLARLRAGVVEFAGLTDDDGARADDENGFDVGALRHCKPPYKRPRRRISIRPSGRRRCRCPDSLRDPPSGAQTP